MNCPIHWYSYEPVDLREKNEALSPWPPSWHMASTSSNLSEVNSGLIKSKLEKQYMPRHSSQAKKIIFRGHFITSHVQSLRECILSAPKSSPTVAIVQTCWEDPLVCSTWGQYLLWLDFSLGVLADLTHKGWLWQLLDVLMTLSGLSLSQQKLSF